MATRLGMVPAVLCIVAAGLLGGWGWGARQDSADQAREEAARRALEHRDGGLFDDGPEPDSVRMQETCGVLVSAALLEVPYELGFSDPGLFGEPDDGGAPVGAPDGGEVEEGPVEAVEAFTGVDVANLLIGVLDPNLVEGVPELDQPELVEAMLGLRSALAVAVTESSEPLAAPAVVAAASALGTELRGPCL